MVRIRLSRTGRKNDPKFRITVADSRRAVSKKYIESIGHYDPIKKSPLFVDLQRYEYWLSVGAQPTPRVVHLVNEFKKRQSQSDKA